MTKMHFSSDRQAPFFITLTIFLQQIKYIPKTGTPFLSYSAALGVNFQKMFHAIQNLQILPIA
jgi:hypothetical protein